MRCGFRTTTAGKKKSTKISRAGAYIKPVMVQCALAAIFVMLTNDELFNPQMYEESLRKPAYILSPELQLAHLTKRLG
ncbi:MAG TPA: hypothetical protein DCM45_07570 [Clostridiales bacterium]|nr:hypothetical protein [Clostridiales bacterium]